MARVPDPDKLRSQLKRMDLDSLRSLYRWLGQLIEEQSATLPKASGRNAIATSAIPTKPPDHWYVWEPKQCNKEGCRCESGIATDLHGPYLYEYWREGEILQKKYHRIRSLPPDAPPRPLIRKRKR